MADNYRVLGMNCGGCAKSVSSAIEMAAPGSRTEVNLEEKSITVTGASEQQVKAAVEDAGFEFAGSI